LRRLTQLFLSPLHDEFDDVGGRRAGQEAGNIFEMDPSTSRYFIARASFGTL
jgi:hypothetical protein